MSDNKPISDDFEFEEGDRVRVRVREHGTRGNILAKFDADVRGFRPAVGPSSDYACFDPPWDSIGGVTLRSTEAEFEVLDS